SSHTFLNTTKHFKIPSTFLTGLFVTGLLFCITPAVAEDKPLKPRVEANIRAGTERSILMTEAWVPLAQEKDRVIFGDMRLMGDDQDSREWNFGLGYREVNDLGDAVL